MLITQILQLILCNGLNTNYGESIPHQYIATIKLSDQDNFQEYALLEKFPNISFIKILIMPKQSINC